VTPGRDADALSWDGDDDPTLDVGAADQTLDVRAAETSGTAALPDGWSAVGKGSEALAPAEAAEVSAFETAPVEPEAAGVYAPQSMGNASLIALGIMAGFSLLYAIGWVIGGLRLRDTAEFLVAPVAYQVSLWLAVLAPLVWFGSVYLLTSGSKPWVRFAWLIGGVLLLVPWPFIMVGAIGQ